MNAKSSPWTDGRVPVRVPVFKVSAEDPDMLSDETLYEFGSYGLHVDKVHEWVQKGPKNSHCLTERAMILIDLFEDAAEMHPLAWEWISDARLIINLISGGSVGRDLMHEEY
jgi:hypothetical protein